MRTWRTAIIFAATLGAGCTQAIEDGTGPRPDGADPDGVPNAPGAPGSPGGTPAPGSTVGPGGTPSPGGTAGPGSTPSTACTPSVAETSQIPRLTNLQYDRTVRDLLGVTALSASGNVAPSTLLATDQSGGLSELGWSAYKSVAEMIAAQVMASPALKANFMKCTPTGNGAKCLHDTIVEFGRRAFRRPLTDEEVAGFESLVSRGAEITATGSPDEIAEVLLYVFLISPSFIQRAEIAETADGAGRFVLSNHEVASRLSYMLWGTMPDAVLSQAADEGRLTTKEQILEQAQRMLQDPRARQMVAAFHRFYLHLGTNTRWDNANHDKTAFPAFDKAMVPAMAAETEMFFEKVVFDGGGFQDLLLSTKAFVNAATAPLYGLDASRFGADLQETELDPTVRPGFLTRVGFLNAYSGYNRTSPILRGAFITKDVLGIAIGAPPPGAEGAPLPSSADLDTNRKQVDAQTSAKGCAECHHAFINPPGFVMEAFDAVGRVQTKERTTGAPIDGVADVTIDGTPVRVTSPGELMQKIAGSRSARRYYAQKWVAYAYERDGHPADECTVERLADKLTPGYTVLNLITDLTQTESFRLRTVEVAQ